MASTSIQASSDIDLFSPGSLTSPFENYRRIRDLGAAVYMERLDVHAIGRFADVQRALRSADALVSGQGVGFNAVFNTPRNPNVIQADDPLHRRMRSVLAKPLMPSQLKSSRALLRRLIGDKVAQLVDQPMFDGMTELARHLPVQAIAHLVGLEAGGRESMLDWAAATFNSMGPDDPAMAGEFGKLLAARDYLGQLDRGRLTAGSWADKLFDARDEGLLSDSEARGALAAYVMPSLDTTILSKGHMIYNLARNPRQWELLKRDPSLVPAAVLETVRHTAVVRWFSRVAVNDYAAGDVFVPAGGRVMLMYGSANRDERRFPEPDRFDVRRDTRDQLAWGTGPHMCVGMHLARIEMEVMLEVLIEQVSRIEVGEPAVSSNRGLYGFEVLPMTLKGN